MKSAKEVSELIEHLKNYGIPMSDAAWEAALACEGWAYVYGAYGEYCDPSNRRSRYSSDHKTIKTKCKNFNGKDSVPAGCVGCQWFLGNAESDPKTHEGRTRFFDCRGFVYWILHNVCGMWNKCPAGATSMWNNKSNWKARGLVKDGVPDDVLVCLFQQKADEPKKMAHIGFGFHGETVECQVGVQYFKQRNSKWTHWAIPVCVDYVPPEPGPEPVKHKTLRKGDKGPEVKEMQEKLLKHGERLPKFGADGSFGNETLAAVKSFQKSHGLVVDGICGPKTWAELDKE